MAERAQWMYDMFGSTGKAIDKRQKDMCKKQGMTFDRATGKCKTTKEAKK